MEPRLRKLLSRRTVTEKHAAGPDVSPAGGLRRRHTTVNVSPVGSHYLRERSGLVTGSETRACAGGELKWGRVSGGLRKTSGPSQVSLLAKGRGKKVCGRDGRRCQDIIVASLQAPNKSPPILNS